MLKIFQIRAIWLKQNYHLLQYCNQGRNFNGLGLGLGPGCTCLRLGLGGPGFVYRVSRTGLGLEAGLET